MKIRNSKTKQRGNRPRSKRATIAAVIRLEERVWAAAQERNAKEFKELVPADAMMIFQSGIVLQPEYLATMHERTISRYQLRRIDGFMPNPNNCDPLLRSRAHRRRRRQSVPHRRRHRKHHVDQARQAVGRRPESRNADRD